MGLGHQLELVLPENPTTGYRWYSSKRVASMALVQDRVDTADGPPGKGGSRHWVFKAVHPGNAEIRAVYRRAWESDRRAAQLRIVVVVAPK